LLDAPERVLFLLDCDTIVVRDPLPFLTGDAFEAKIAPTPTGSPTIPYFNAGVFAIPTEMARTLAPVWRRYNEVLADKAAGGAVPSAHASGQPRARRDRHSASRAAIGDEVSNERAARHATAGIRGDRSGHHSLSPARDRRRLPVAGSLSRRADAHRNVSRTDAR
jgi:hypothetical protein